MSKEKFSKIEKGLNRQGIVILYDEYAQELLEYRNADAITLNQFTILVKPDASASEVFEEIIHTKQFKDGSNNGNPLDRKNNLYCEIEACNKLIK